MLRVRPYRSADAAAIQTWIRDEREHALWCANLIDYPPSVDALDRKRMALDAEGYGTMFTALNAADIPVGFFAVMRLETRINNAHLGFIIVDPAMRGKRIGRHMVQLAAGYCFHLLGADSITLKVYDQNEAARKCYKAAGFVDVAHNDKSLMFGKEKWGTWDMIITRKRSKRFLSL
jgi:RimJ/RimL family protein N-acetyltransferase